MKETDVLVIRDLGDNLVHQEMRSGNTCYFILHHLTEQNALWKYKRNDLRAYPLESAMQIGSSEKFCFQELQTSLAGVAERFSIFVARA
jgi:hypothetical protein